MEQKVKEYVLGFMFSQNMREVVLVTKNRPEKQFGKLNGVGGSIEETDATGYDAMAREFGEETGLKTEPTDWTQFAVLQGGGWVVFCYFTIDGNLRDVKTMTDEKIDVYRVDYLNHYSIMSNLPWLIEMARDPNFLMCNAAVK